MKKEPDLKMAFFGTSRFAVHVLEELAKARLLPALVVTAPDKPQGRGLTVQPPAAKVWAQENNIGCLQPEKLDGTFIAELGNPEHAREPKLSSSSLGRAENNLYQTARLREKRQTCASSTPKAIYGTGWDLFVVAAYGKILPKEIIGLPKHGILNVHPSLLPRHRGPAPIQAAILKDDYTGVTIMQIDEEMDHGPIVAQARVEPARWPPKAAVLSELLAHEGGKLLVEVIPAWVEGSIQAEEQDHEKAIYVRKFTKEDGLIDLSEHPEKNYRKVQALGENPGVYFFAIRNGKRVRVKITDAKYKDGSLHLIKVIPEGKKEMDYQDFLRGKQ